MPTTKKTFRGYRLLMAVFLVLGGADALAECINPLVTPTECQFKREDTHLWGIQPGFSFVKDDRVDELITQGRTFIDSYYANVKTTGDIAQRMMIAPTAFSMTVIEAQQIASTAIIYLNDPWRLKELGQWWRFIPPTDITCQIYWTIVSQGNRLCPTTFELLTNVLKLQELDEVRQQITDIVLNPNLFLGEQWADSITEITDVRDRLASLDTFGRNIALPDIEDFFDSRYPSLTELVGAPDETRAQFRTRVEELNNSRRDTIREHMMATAQNYKNLRTKDQPELDVLNDMSSRAVGRMQSMEIQNMLDIQNVQNMQMLSEEIMNMTTMTMQDMADAHGDATRRNAYTIKSAEPIPFHEAATGNGQGFMQ